MGAQPPGSWTLGPGSSEFRLHGLRFRRTGGTVSAQRRPPWHHPDSAGHQGPHVARVYYGRTYNECTPECPSTGGICSRDERRPRSPLGGRLRPAPSTF